MKIENVLERVFKDAYMTGFYATNGINAILEDRDLEKAYQKWLTENHYAKILTDKYAIISQEQNEKRYK